MNRPTPAAIDAALEGIINLAEFRAVLRQFQRHSEDVARSWGLTPQRYLLLLMIKGAPDGGQRLNLTQLAHRLQLSKNSVTELAARAEAAGLIKREGDKGDQRLVYLRLTADGERRLRGAVLEGRISRAQLSQGFTALTRSYRALSRADPAD